jgi:bifunctional UDP-N-acetylglucosamine pyrophosphorylase/glucosamine-1-phosphate N-acetyltransferase
MGVNSQAELAAAEQAFQRRRRGELMAAGVTMVAPQTVCLAWDTAIAAGATVEPFVVFAPGVRVEAGAQIRAFSHLEGALVREGALVGPYARLRPGADIGAGANIGAGAIFCNYDGFDKFDTHVGAGAFIGSNTALVAPISVADGAYTGSGSVITRDVGADALALGRGQQVEKPGWAKAFRARKQRERAGK